MSKWDFKIAQQELTRGGIVPVSSDALIYRQNENGETEVLIGVRGNDPWKGFITVPFGGYMAPEDKTPIETAKRETVEETGETTQELHGLKVEIGFLVGIYGPHRRRYTIKLADDLETRDEQPFVVERLNEQAHVLPVLAIVFAAEVVEGEITDTAEQSGIRFMEIGALVTEFGDRMAFDHALALHDFYEINQGKRLDPWDAFEFFHGDD